MQSNPFWMQATTDNTDALHMSAMEMDAKMVNIMLPTTDMMLTHKARESQVRVQASSPNNGCCHTIGLQLNNRLA